MDNSHEAEVSNIEILNNTIPPSFSPSTQLDNEIQVLSHASFEYSFSESLLDHLIPAELIVYCLIKSLSTSYGYCFMTNENLAKRARNSVRSIERILMSLEKKGFIYRNTYNVIRGRKRHIIIKDKFLYYWENVLSHPKIPTRVRREFLKRALKVGDKDLPPPTDPDKLPGGAPSPDSMKFTDDIQPSELAKNPKKTSTTTKSGDCLRTTKSGGSILLRNISSKEERQTTRGSPEIDVVGAFEKKIVLELATLNITGERAKMAVEYYQENKKLVESKANPIGWIIQGVQKGWISDMVCRKKEQELRKRYDERPKPPPPAPKPAAPKKLEGQDLARVKEILKRFQSLADPEHIKLTFESDGFVWEASNQGGVSWKQPYVQGCLRILATLAKNMEQYEALDYIESKIKEVKHENLCA